MTDITEDDFNTLEFFYTFAKAKLGWKNESLTIQKIIDSKQTILQALQLQKRIEERISYWHQVELRILEINEVWRFKLNKREWHEVIYKPLTNARNKQEELQQLLKSDKK